VCAAALGRAAAARRRGARTRGAERRARAPRSIAVTAKRTTRRMGLGAFIEAVIETDSGAMLMRAGEAATAATVVDGSARIERVRGAITDLASTPADAASIEASRLTNA